MGTLSWKTDLTQPSPMEALDASGMLDMATKSSVWSRVMLKLALKPGSSKHGKIFRALVRAVNVEVTHLQLDHGFIFYLKGYMLKTLF